MCGFDASFAVIRVFAAVETLVRDADQLGALVAVLGIGGDAVVHGNGDIKIERAKNFGEDDADTPAEGRC